MDQVTIDRIVARGPFCQTCDPESLFTGPRLGENHFATRLSDDDRRMNVSIDGKHDTSCLEVMAGDPGWALRMTWEPDGRRLAVCRNCLQDVLTELVIGRIDVYNGDPVERAA